MQEELALEMTRDQFAQSLFDLRGDQLSFQTHGFMPAIINCTDKRILMKCSRQVGKSTINSIRLGTDGAAAEVHSPRLIYVSPTQEQTKQFSVEKLDPLLWDSKLFKKMYLDGRCRKDVFMKSLTNGAMMFLRAAFRTADRVRGIPGDELLLDEVQDILPGNIPVMESALDASELGRMIYTGTPKATDNIIEEMYQNSTQTELHVPCFRHSPIQWNILQTGIENIGKDGLICSKCKKPIDARYAVWRDLYPNAPIKGFHVTQLAVSWKQSKQKWHDEIIYKLENWSEDMFYNETLGVSYGHAQKPLSLEDIQEVCHPNAQHKSLDTSKLHEKPPKVQGRQRFFAGVDWGEGRDVGGMEDGKMRHASYTILVIGTYNAKGQFAILFWKKFKGKEARPDFVKKFVINKLREWNVEVAGLDWGFGWGMNQDIANAIGISKTAQVFHSANLKALYKFDPVSYKLIVNRNALIASLVSDVKKGKIIFPPWEDTRWFAKDFTALRCEYNESLRRMAYYHSHSEPDDTVHAVLYAKLMADLAMGIISPENNEDTLLPFANQPQPQADSYYEDDSGVYQFDQWDEDFA